MHVFYHDDFDGVASAAILAGCLKDVLNTPCTFEAVNYHLKSRWHDPKPLREDDYAIVDFLFHPGAKVWFDHHETTFIQQPYADAFSANLENTSTERPVWVWNAHAPSCGKFIYDQLTVNGPETLKKYQTLAEYADLVDAVQYESPEACYDLSHPATALNHAHRYLSEGTKSSVIQALMTGDIESSLSVASAGIATAQVKVPQALAQYSNLYARHNEVVFVSTLGEKVPLMRFAPFISCPTAAYAVILYGGGNGKVRVSAVKNPWLDFIHKDLSQLMAQFGGGGHQGAAATNFENPDTAVTEGWNCARHLIQVLNQ